MASITLGTPKRMTRWYLAAACVLGLAGMAAGIGAWKTIAQKDSAAPTAVQHASSPRVATADHEQVGPATLDDSLTVYIVSSEDDAVQARRAIDDGNLILDQLGRPRFKAEVIVARSAEEDAAVMRAYADADAIRVGMGLPGITVLDLRTQQ